MISFIYTKISNWSLCTYLLDNDLIKIVCIQESIVPFGNYTKY